MLLHAWCHACMEHCPLSGSRTKNKEVDVRLHYLPNVLLMELTRKEVCGGSGSLVSSHPWINIGCLCATAGWDSIAWLVGIEKQCYLVSYKFFWFGWWEMRFEHGKSNDFLYLASPGIGNGCLSHGKIWDKWSHSPPLVSFSLSMEN